MSEATRSGPFWDMIEGRAPMPPVARLLGWTLLSIDPERGEIRVRFEAKADFLNPAGTLQGGILSAMLDDTMGPAAVALLGGNRLQTNARPASIGRRGRDRSSALAASRTAGANWSFSKGRCRTAKESHSRRRRRPPASSSLGPSNKLLPAVHVGRQRSCWPRPATLSEAASWHGNFAACVFGRDRLGRDCLFLAGSAASKQRSVSAVRSASPNRICS